MKSLNKSFLFFIVVVSLTLAQNNMLSGGGLMEISSSAFRDREKIPVQHAMPGAGGQNLSVPLTWKNIPPGTRSFALSIVDIHPIAQSWVHWLVINIPSQMTSLEEGASGMKMPAGAMELKNSFGDIGYGGPQPPPGTGDHTYVVTIYALNVERLGLGANASLSQFKKALEGKVTGSAS
ncbi:MAG: YbhB/YbcL family Raf kinase inhibitor-like protein, partial [Nitrospirae bacterium]|nr:YbhB/YbcL family Raf kinase inhibitor-like protein [Nitrospirota bacterium]